MSRLGDKFILSNRLNKWKMNKLNKRVFNNQLTYNRILEVKPNFHLQHYLKYKFKQLLKKSSEMILLYRTSI